MQPEERNRRQEAEVPARVADIGIAEVACIDKAEDLTLGMRDPEPKLVLAGRRSSLLCIDMRHRPGGDGGDDRSRCRRGYGQRQEYGAQSHAGCSQRSQAPQINLAMS